MQEQVHEELSKLCESDFQKGKGRAQIRNSDNFDLVFDCETLHVAKSICNFDNDQCVLWRAKVRGERRYHWVLVS